MKARAVKGGVPGLFVALRESSRESGARPVEVLPVKPWAVKAPATACSAKARAVKSRTVKASAVMAWAVKLRAVMARVVRSWSERWRVGGGWGIGVVLVLVAGCGPAERPYVPKDAPASVAGTAPSSGATPESSGRSAEPGTVPSAGGSAAPSAAASLTAPSPGAETVTLGEKVRVRIEWPTGADPRLRLVADYYLNSRRAVVTGDDRYLDNLEFEAASQAHEWVSEFADQERSLRGVARLYNLRVQAVVGRAVQVNTCVDESRLRLISTRTGKAVSPQPEWTREPYMQAVAARRGDDGVWRIRTFVHGTEGCGR